MLRPFAVFLILASLSFPISVVSPVQGEVGEGDTIDLGVIGPGQTVSILIGRQVYTGGIYGEGGYYDFAVAEDLPSGWASEGSDQYDDPHQVTITADPNAPEGNYTAKIKVIDEYNGEKLGNVTFNVKVRITWDVMDFDVSPTEQVVGPGQPARFDINITNKGSTSDVFLVSAEGPRKWEFKKPVFIPAMSTKIEPYEIVGYEEEEYRATIKVVSLASSNIADEENVSIKVESGLLGDYRATNNGVMVFPIFEMPIYALAGLISNLFG